MWSSKAAYHGITAGTSETYFNFPAGSNTVLAVVAIGTAPGTAVYGQPWPPSPADITQVGGLSPHGTVGQGATSGGEKGRMSTS